MIMKSLNNLRAGGMILMLILLSGTYAWADVDDYLLSVRDVTHTSSTIEFDLYLLDTDDDQTFEFAALQMGLLLSSSIYGEGALTVSYNNSGSGLEGDQQFVGSVDVVSSLAGYPGQTLIRLMPNSIPPVPPGAGSGTVISSTGDGTLLAHFTITSSVSFTPNSRPDLIFCASDAVSPLFPTILSSYINGDATSLVVTPGINAIVDGNPLLNATKTLTLTSVLLEGLYNGGGTMREVSNAYTPQYPGLADRITIELHDAASYSTLIYSVPNVDLSLTGTATVSIPAEYSGSYYITVKHRNSIETTTASPVSFASETINQSFGARAHVFGENLKSSGEGYYLIYGADVNQDGLVDTGDMNDVDNGSTAILIGYNFSDANGDGLVDTSDMNMVDNNSAAIVYVRIPL